MHHLQPGQDLGGTLSCKYEAQSSAKVPNMCVQARSYSINRRKRRKQFQLQRTSSNCNENRGKRRSLIRVFAQAGSKKLKFGTILVCVMSLLYNRFSTTEALSSYGMPTVYLDGSGANECERTMKRVIQDWSGFIYSHEPFYERYAGGKNCFLVLRAPENYRIRLVVLDFYLNVGSSKNGKGKCPGDSLHIFDQEESKKDSKPTGIEGDPGPGPMIGLYCGKQTNGTILAESTLNELTLWWHTDSEIARNHNGRGFRLLWTIFRKLPQGHECNEFSEFRCKNRQCIPAKLACDRVSHCSDSSDLEIKRQRERGCTNIPEPTVLSSLGAAALAGICIASVLGIVLLCVIISVCCREQCRRKQRNGSGGLRHYPPGGDTSAMVAANGCAPTDQLTGGSPQHIKHAQAQPNLYGNQRNIISTNLLQHSQQTKQLMKQPYHGPGRGPPGRGLPEGNTNGYCNSQQSRTFDV